MTRSLVIKCTAGVDDAERCNQAFTVAATALAAGVEVSLWLTGEAAWLAVPGRAEEFSLPEATPLSQLRDAVLAGVEHEPADRVTPLRMGDVGNEEPVGDVVDVQQVEVGQRPRLPLHVVRNP